MKKFDVFEGIEGLEPIDPKVLEEFKREMNEKVIPEITQAIYERRVLAAESRQWIFK